MLNFLFENLIMRLSVKLLFKIGFWMWNHYPSHLFYSPSQILSNLSNLKYQSWVSHKFKISPISQLVTKIKQKIQNCLLHITSPQLPFPLFLQPAAPSVSNNNTYCSCRGRTLTVEVAPCRARLSTSPATTKGNSSPFLRLHDDQKAVPLCELTCTQQLSFGVHAISVKTNTKARFNQNTNSQLCNYLHKCILSPLKTNNTNFSPSLVRQSIDQVPMQGSINRLKASPTSTCTSSVHNTNQRKEAPTKGLPSSSSSSHAQSREQQQSNSSFCNSNRATTEPWINSFCHNHILDCKTNQQYQKVRSAKIQGQSNSQFDQYKFSIKLTTRINASSVTDHTHIQWSTSSVPSSVNSRPDLQCFNNPKTININHRFR